MAETIDELLVKLGLETDAKGFKEANNQFTNLRTTALTVGAAMGTALVGAGIGLAKMSADVAKSRDGLGKWAEAAGVSIKRAQELAFALAKAGSANPESDMMAMFGNVEKLRTQARRGELPAWAHEAPGLDLYAISSMTNEAALDHLMRGASSIGDKDLQRRVLDTLGFSGTAQLGVMTNYQRTKADYARANELGIADQQLMDNSAAYLDAMTELGHQTANLRDMVADHLLPRMADWIEALTGWIGEHKKGIADTVGIIMGPGTLSEKADALAANPNARAFGGEVWGALQYHPAVAGVMNSPVMRLYNRYFGDNAQSPSGPLSTDAIFNALVQQESGGRHYGDGSMLLSSPKGARGVTQVMPATGRDPGYGVRPLANDSREEYLRFGRDYLAAMMKEFDGDTQKALAAYNAGPGAVKNAVASHGANWLSAMPGETQAYVPSIMGAASKGGTTNYYSIDARGATDPAATEAAVRRVVDERISNAVQVGIDDFPNNVE